MQKIFIPALVSLVIFFSCNNKKEVAAVSTDSLDLKRGDVVSCGPQDGEQYGTVSFSSSIPEKWRTDFNIGVALFSFI